MTKQHRREDARVHETELARRTCGSQELDSRRMFLYPYISRLVPRYARDKEGAGTEWNRGKVGVPRARSETDATVWCPCLPRG